MNKSLVEYWKPIVAALDPMRPLRPDEIEARYVQRPDGPANRIERKLRLAADPSDVKLLICGARGAGKSTELSLLARQLEADYCVVLLDLEAGLPERAGTVGLIALLGAALARATQDWRGPDKDLEERRPAQDAFAAAMNGLGVGLEVFQKILSAVAPVVTLFDPASGTAASAAAATSGSTGALVRKAGKLRRELSREPLLERLSPNSEDEARALVEAVNGLVKTLADLAGRPPLLLADGFDKRTELDDVRVAVADVGLLSDLRAPLILTGPVTLRHDPSFKGLPGGFSVEVLPNVAVRRVDVSGKVVANEAGLRLLLDLFARRDVAAVIGEDQLRAAAMASSGIVREFLELIGWAAEEAFGAGSRQIGPAQMDAAIRRRRLSLQSYLNERRIELLSRVLDKRRLPADEEADVLLFENLLACYSNGDTWFRPHEAIVASVEKFAADDD